MPLQGRGKGALNVRLAELLCTCENTLLLTKRNLGNWKERLEKEDKKRVGTDGAVGFG
jgi:hypothetical protein